MAQEVVTDRATGQPIVTGIDVPVEVVLERLALSGSVERVLEAFPGLTREGFDAAVRYAAVSVRRKVPYDTVAGAGVMVAREAAAAYGRRPPLDEAAAELEAAYAHARYDLELATALRNGFGDLRAGRVTPHAEVMAELRAMLQA
ncbi:MAG TPA: DUF433 domain-containing protein [Longimicrobium sp.]|jgi:uncharacterized protein (DUF433 family)|nr:DUF433 domain-containing protein [Longimicrobium sp.]